MLSPLSAVCCCPFQLLLLVTVCAVFIILAQCCGGGKCCGCGNKKEKADQQGKKSARSEKSRSGDSALESYKVDTKKAAAAKSHNGKADVKNAVNAGSHNAKQPPLDSVQRKKLEKPLISITNQSPDKKPAKKREYVSANHPDYASLKQLDMDIFNKKRLEQKQARPRDFPSQFSLTESKL